MTTTIDLDDHDAATLASLLARERAAATPAPRPNRSHEPARQLDAAERPAWALWCRQRGYPAGTPLLERDAQEFAYLLPELRAQLDAERAEEERRAEAERRAEEEAARPLDEWRDEVRALAAALEELELELAGAEATVAATRARVRKTAARLEHARQIVSAREAAGAQERDRAALAVADARMTAFAGFVASRTGVTEDEARAVLGALDCDTTRAVAWIRRCAGTPIIPADPAFDL